ncbi:hypothetical protein [Schumannella sp. 10F1B-5-1]|uniref:hypothetical protein n=1 Tax=Schumannella sp. 10F1B-5-1 TaxID=2590780 RepID=UPI0015E839EE|nr:hypothetical protein [Schumannella sp. 10F1B-5-1]
MSSTTISLDLQTLAHHVGKLRGAHGELLRHERVNAGLLGHGSDGAAPLAAENTFYSWMRDSASALEKTTVELQKQIAQNSDALTAAAEKLAARQDLSAQQLAQIRALIDQAGQAPGGSGSAEDPASPATPTPGAPAASTAPTAPAAPGGVPTTGSAADAASSAAGGL